jgi:hypothetical protein
MKTEDKKPAPKKEPGRIFDVSRPGKAAASPTSRPVIMGHKPEAQQAQTSVSGIGEASPLLNRKIAIVPGGDRQKENENQPVPELPPEDVPAGAPSQTEKDALGTAALDSVTGPPPVSPEKEAEALPVKAKVIEPLSETDTQPEASQVAEPSEPAKPEPEPEPTAEELPKDTSSSVPETETETVNEPADPLKPEDAPPELDIEPLFDPSGHIVVSHHAHNGGHALKVLGLLLLIVLLAVVAVDLLLDLGLLNVEGIPRTDFF